MEKKDEKKPTDDALDIVDETKLSEKEQGLAAREAKLAVAEKELADKERLAAVKAQQEEVDRREDSLKEQDEVIDNYQSGKKAKPGQAFIDSQHRQHAGNCNSHPSKRKSFPCDCGKNGTARYKPQQ